MSKHTPARILSASECGCTFRHDGRPTCGKIVYCPLHGAAKELLAACAELLEIVTGWTADGVSVSPLNDIGEHRVVVRARAAIALSKPQPRTVDNPAATAVRLDKA